MVLQVPTYKDKSGIHGIGLFTKEAIPRGTLVWRFTEGVDLELTQEQLDQLTPVERAHIQHYCYFCRESMRYVLCADDARFFNHSMTPNCMSLDDGTTVAAHDIAPKEELTDDYRTFDGSYEQHMRSAR